MRDSLTATPINSFQEIQAEWLGLLAECPVNTIFLMPQWQEIWWDAFHREPENEREMAGFYLRQPAGVTAIASLSRHDRALSFVGNSETFDYNDFMISPGCEADFFAALMGWLEQENWETLELPSLIETSPTLEHLPDLAQERGYLVEISPEDVTPGLALPATWEEYLAGLSKKNRHELRRKLRRLEAVENWRWYSVREPDEVAARLDDFLALMCQSDPEKAAYMTPEREAFFRRVAQRTAQLDLLRLFFLEIDGKTWPPPSVLTTTEPAFSITAGTTPITAITAWACCSTPCACGRPLSWDRIISISCGGRSRTSITWAA